MVIIVMALSGIDRLIGHAIAQMLCAGQKSLPT